MPGSPSAPPGVQAEQKKKAPVGKIPSRPDYTANRRDFWNACQKCHF